MPTIPAAVAMFTEEVGVDPRAGDGGRNYRARVAGLLSAGRAFARFEGDQVVYKAEIGAMSSRVALIQGVWVHPDLRGQGQAASGTAAVVAAAQRLGRLPSLYVNHHNRRGPGRLPPGGVRQGGHVRLDPVLISCCSDPVSSPVPGPDLS